VVSKNFILRSHVSDENKFYQVLSLVMFDGDRGFMILFLVENWERDKYKLNIIDMQ
jgi:hypothetical protein